MYSLRLLATSAVSLATRGEVNSEANGLSAPESAISLVLYSTVALFISYTLGIPLI